MVFEHLAINVDDVSSVVDWYVTHMGLKVVSAQKNAPFMTFLADSSNRVVLELYQKPDLQIIDFSKIHQLTFHMAFVSENSQKDRERLEQEGASYVEEVRKADGGHLVMMRDPWGMPLQLCERVSSL
ncbi:MAG: VOC family protein [Flavobacteriaceae bacterium]